MKSGLRDRNNRRHVVSAWIPDDIVSMKSGLRDRNNDDQFPLTEPDDYVSMKSGLRDRNNGRA